MSTTTARPAGNIYFTETFYFTQHFIEYDDGEAGWHDLKFRV